MKGNFGFASDLLNCLKKHNNKATIMLSSSIQLRWLVVLATASMVAARRLARNCSSSMLRRLGQRWRSTAL